MKVPLFEAQTEWIEPEEYPDLRSYDEIAIDLETRDPDLKSKGSGAIIGNGEVLEHWKEYQKKTKLKKLELELKQMLKENSIKEMDKFINKLVTKNGTTKY